MTIKECIDIVDELKPNQYSTKIKVMWLSFIDEIIINDVLKTHRGYDGRYDDFTGYSEEKLSVPLIVASPYDRLYTAYLKMKIDAENGETARYNNSAGLFNSYMMEYRKYYNKTHMPLSEAEKRVFETVDKISVGISKSDLENLKRDLSKMLKENTEIVESALSKTNTNTNKITSVTLYANRWAGTSSPYTQVVTISGVTVKSKIDLNPTVEQLHIFHSKDLAFVVGNNNGIITVYCVGQKPTNDYTMQATITEVVIDD